MNKNWTGRNKFSDWPQEHFHLFVYVCVIPCSYSALHLNFVMKKIKTTVRRFGVAFRQTEVNSARLEEKLEATETRRNVAFVFVNIRALRTNC